MISCDHKRQLFIQTIKDEDLTWEKASARLLQEYDTRQAVLKDGKGGEYAGQNKIERALRTKANVQCYKYGKFGHYKRACRSKGRYDKNQKSNGQVRVNEDHRALLVRQQRAASKEMIVDSGASSHMFYNRTTFPSSVQGALVV